MDAQGRVAVMWRNWLNGSRDMFAALSSDGGKTFATAQKLGSGTWKLNGCPMDGGSIAVRSPLDRRLPLGVPPQAEHLRFAVVAGLALAAGMVLGRMLPR